MDGGVKQEGMAEQLKREVKANAHRRRGERVIDISGGDVSLAEAPTSGLIVLPQETV